MLKKMLLLAGAAMALVAFAVPVGAQGNEWYTDVGGSEVKAGSSTATGDQITLTGELTMTAGPGFAFRSGPCQGDATTFLWNSSGQATAEGTDAAGTTPCDTNVPGCRIDNAGPSGGFPWHIDVNGDNISITGVGFFVEYNDGCTGMGLPPGVKLGGSGTLTALFNTSTHCLDFNGEGDLSGALGPIKIDGKVCNADGNTVTLK